jgi:hypothetical protein
MAGQYACTCLYVLLSSALLFRYLKTICKFKSCPPSTRHSLSTSESEIESSSSICPKTVRVLYDVLGSPPAVFYKRHCRVSLYSSFYIFSLAHQNQKRIETVAMSESSDDEDDARCPPLRRPLNRTSQVQCPPLSSALCS